MPLFFAIVLIKSSWCVIYHTRGINLPLKNPARQGMEEKLIDMAQQLKLRILFFGFLVIVDCYKEDILQQQSGDEDVFFCTWCYAEFQDFSQKGLS